MHNFYFGGNNLAQFGGRILQPPSYHIAARDGELFELPGRSGDFFQDNKRYKNKEFSLKIEFLPFLTQENRVQLARSVINWLSGLIGYQIYRDTYNPGYFTKAVLTNFDEIVQELSKLLTTTLTFSRLPFWYRNDGQNVIEVPSDGSELIINNPEPLSAAPIIMHTNNGRDVNGVLSINGVELTFPSSIPSGNISGSTSIQIDNHILDGVARQFTAKSTSNGKVYVNSLLPPDLIPGDNTVRLVSGKWSEFNIIPNWRRL